MRLQILSDIHLDHHRDGGAAFLYSLPAVEADVIVVAGDIANSTSIGQSLGMLARHFAPKPVVFVLGNHDYYGSTPEKVHKTVQQAVDRSPNLHWLQNSTTTIEGVTFAGTTLWFPTSPSITRSLELDLNDFHLIKVDRSWFYQQHEQAAAFLQNVQADVVVTHHLPSELAVSGPFKGHPLNAFFVAPLLDIPGAIPHPPKVWAFGHTHTGCQVLHPSGTQLVCNPLGYPRQRSTFVDNLVHEVS